MKFTPPIFAKASFTKEQISVKDKIGCSGIEVQLLDEMIIDRCKGIYKPAEDAYDLSLLSQYDIRVVHCPLVQGLGDITLERMADNIDGYLMEQVFLIAEEASKCHGRLVPVVIHSEEFYDRLSDMGDSWNRIAEKVSFVLNKYPHTELLIENVSPLRGIGKGKELHLANNCMFDNILMVQKLREQTGVDRIGTCLDTCHQMLTEKYLNIIYQTVADVPIPDLSLDTFFAKNKEYIKLIHLCDIAGSGYGKGRHGVPFHAGSYVKLKKIMDTYHSYNIECPITLEVEETDYSTCDGYRITKDLIDTYYSDKSSFDSAMSIMSGE